VLGVGIKCPLFSPCDNDKFCVSVHPLYTYNNVFVTLSSAMLDIIGKTIYGRVGYNEPLEVEDPLRYW